MTTKTFDVAAGHVLPDMSALDLPTAQARKAELQSLLAQTRDNPARAKERERLRAEDEAVTGRIRTLKENQKAENTRRNFAGLTSPLYEAIAARFDAGTVAELEADALARFDERLRRAAEKRAKKTGSGTPSSIDKKREGEHG